MRLMIVEDDYITMEGIIKMVRWDELGIDSLTRADDGLRAVEMAASFHPDIVLSDIRMPRLDGIGFAMRLREMWPECKIIFMSAYVDIAYCKEAIKLGAVRVIEKPIQLLELTQALSDAVEHCRREQARRMDARQAHQALSLSLPLIRGELSAMLIGQAADRERIAQMLRLIGLELPQDALFTVMLIHIREGFYGAGCGGADVLPWQSGLEALIQEHGFMGFSALHDEQTIVMHLCTAQQGGTGEGGHVKARLEELCRAVLRSLTQQRCASIAVGEPALGYQGIANAFATAIQVRRRLFITNERIGIYDLIGQRREYPLNPQLDDEFTLNLRQRNEEELFSILRRLTQGILANPDTHLSRIRVLYLQLAMRIEQIASSQGLEMSVPQADHSLWDTICRFPCLKDLDAWLGGLIGEYLALAAEKRRYSATVRAILEYIHAHYHEKTLSTADISKHFYLSTAYICVLFKQETEETISHYINRYRVERSREYLRDPQVKIADIAREVGYRDADYFARVFRKLEGIAPSEYREAAGGR